MRGGTPGTSSRASVELLALRGDPERARTLLDAAPGVFEHDVTGTREGSVAYVQRSSTGLVKGLLRTLHDHDIVIDWPAYPLANDHGLTLTVVGTSGAIGAAAADLPANLDVSLERTGEYGPDTGRLVGPLTDRQRDLLELAVREGYHEVPRRTTHRELASNLGLATSTVSERLQRIEATLVATIVDS